MPSVESIELKVGLEVHVELATRSKMFSRAPSPAHPDHYHAPPNSLIDPTVLALPGSLPVMNREAVEMAIMVGLALNCRIADVARWERKGYFYPDLPKGYQISQYKAPLCAEGVIHIPPTDERGFFDPTRPGTPIRIIRAHLEEDAGKLLHEAPGGQPIDGTIVDYNRAGTPLLEIVTQPDFDSAERVVAFARALRAICRFLGVTEGIMQMGHMRFEPNINTILTLSDGRRVATPIVEIKNLNSFRSLRRAVEHELERQPKQWLDSGAEMRPGSKQTRGWDDDRGVSLPQREKEEAHDYRYFPDPDLPPVHVPPAWLEQIRARMTVLPLVRLERYVERLGLNPSEAAMLTEERLLCDLFDASITATGLDEARAARLVANVLLQGGARIANERNVPIAALGLEPGQIASLVRLREDRLISSNAADEILALLTLPEHRGADPRQLAEARGLISVQDETQLREWCVAAVEANPKSVADVRSGKTAAIGRLVGEVMKASHGRADPRRTRELLQEIISND